MFLRMFIRFPVAALPSNFKFQPIDAGEVAEHILIDAARGPSARLPDLGGPEVLTAGDIAAAWLKARNKRAVVLPLPLPGKVASAFRAGYNCTPNHAEGKITWADWLARSIPPNKICNQSSDICHLAMSRVLLIPHLDAGDRDRWPGDQDERPLSDLGRRQAQALNEALSGESLTHLYASPALRCRQTLEPLASTFGLAIETLPALAEKQPGESRDAMASRGSIALQTIANAAQNAAVCSHGDLIPAVVDLLVREHDLPPPEPLQERGQWYELTLSDDTITAIQLRR